MTNLAQYYFSFCFFLSHWENISLSYTLLIKYPAVFSLPYTVTNNDLNFHIHYLFIIFLHDTGLTDIHIIKRSQWKMIIPEIQLKICFFFFLGSYSLHSHLGHNQHKQINIFYSFYHLLLRSLHSVSISSGDSVLQILWPL